MTAGCPVCGHALREVGDRLVCREHGMLIPEESLRSLVGALDVVEDGQTIHACPRCAGRMEGCLLVAGDVQQSGSRCRAHGIWVGSDLAELLAGGAATTSGGTGAPGWGGARYSYGGAGGVRSHVATSMSALVRSTDHIMLGRRKFPQKRGPRAPGFTSAYADRQLACPRCAPHALRLAGDRWDCDRCEGSFVETAALEQMMAAMTGSPWHAPPSTGPDGPRACPVCTAPLVLDVFEPVQIDRCATHGVWFDPAELAALLQASTGVDERPTGAAAWFRRLLFEE